MVNIDNLPDKLKSFLNARRKTTYNYREFPGTCGMNILYDLHEFGTSKARQFGLLIHVLFGVSHVVFTDTVKTEKSVFKHDKAIAQKGVIGINPNSENKIRTYTVTWDILLKAIKINPKDKKWK